MRGEGLRTLGASGFSRDHPRVCGEKSGNCRLLDRVNGSPPRVRGEEGTPFLLCGRERITPACAGRSLRRIENRSRGEDHPRVCGEKSDRFRYCVLEVGSPPRVRGEVTGTGGCTRGRRDHPRVCGEKCLIRSDSIMGKGSPPRVRGEAPCSP